MIAQVRRSRLPGFWVVLGLVATGLLGGCGEAPGIEVTRSYYGARWPYFLFDRGVVRCEVLGQRPIVTIDLGGGIYGLNGAALSAGYRSEKHARNLNEWGMRVPVPYGNDGFIELGLALCRR